MGGIILRGLIAGLVVIAIFCIPSRMERLRALVLTLPVLSLIVFVMAWQRERDLAGISVFARETLVLVPLGLPFFVPLAFARSWGLGFWPAFLLGVMLAAAAISLWFWLGPRSP